MSPTDQVLGHVEYVAGAAVEKVGEAVNNQNLVRDGEEHKQQAVEVMRASAGPSDSTAHNTALGSLEKKAGELVGCEGMEREGSIRETLLPGTTAGAQPAAVDPASQPASASAAAFDAQKQV